MYLLDLVKSLFIRKVPTIVNSTTSTLTIPRSARLMLAPERSVLVWRDPPDAKKKNETISLVLAYEHLGKTYNIALKRSINEDFLNCSLKLRHKLAQCISAQPKTNVTDATMNLNIDISVDPPCSIEDSVFEIIKSRQFIRIGDRNFRILLEPTDISAVNLFLIPFVGCPIFPSLDFRPGQNGVAPAAFHWFRIIDENMFIAMGKGKKSKVVEIPPQIRLIDDDERTFTVNGCEFLSRGHSFIPSQEDVGKRLLVIADLGSGGIARAGITKHVVRFIDEPMLCDKRLKWCHREKSANSFRVVSYNILADLYLNLSLPQEGLFFPHCPKEFQLHEYRYPLLLKEIKEYNADMYFLQEVDMRMNLRYLSPLFKSMDMEMIFAKKQKEVNEGSAIAFKSDTYRLLSSELFGIPDLFADMPENADVREMVENNLDAKESFCCRPTILQVIVVENKVNNEILVCGNTHLHHDPKHEHFKVLQGLIALRKLHSIQLQHQSNSKRIVRILFGGDFNSTPDGPLFRLFSQGTIPTSDSCWNLEPKIQPEVLNVPIHLTNLSGTPKFTNYTRNSDGRGFVGTLDYIWGSGFETVAYCPETEETDVLKYIALPSKISPSDHVPLIIDIRPL